MSKKAGRKSAYEQKIKPRLSEIKKWLEKDITTLDKLEAYKLQQNQKEVDSDVRRGKGNLKNEGPTNDPESEATRRRELLRQIEELERDEL